MGARVLIVDDHPSFRASARAILEADGFEVVGDAATGAEALENISRFAPDVVLLDVQLPDMTGFDICSVACTDGGPAVVLVSSREAEDYDGLLDTCGAVGFIPKAELTGRAVLDLLG